MRKYIYASALALSVSALSTAYASIEMKYDPALVGEDITYDNVEAHLDNLTILFMQGRDDLLNKMDSEGNELDDEEFQVIVAHAARLNKYERAALNAALKVRDESAGNKHALKQVQNALLVTK